MAVKPSVTIYTDGGCKPNPGPGGWAALLMAQSGHVKEISGAEWDTTNNRMELTAAIEALRALQKPCNITFFTDSEYVRNGIENWLRGWIENGWQTENETPVKNQDRWQDLHAEIQRHHIKWRWVKGHAGDEYNERVDQLATAARERLTGLASSPVEPPPLPADVAPDYEIAFRVSVPKSGGPGGWAYRVSRVADQNMGDLYTGEESATTSNRLELIAALDALRQVPPGAAVRVYCLGDYVFRGMTEWVANWQRRGWKTAGKKPVSHRELWEALVEETGRRSVQWLPERDEHPPLAYDLDKLAADAVPRS